eukprot:TRINITY_DN11343_c0_g1_i10.p1 TRINITY_DN11343_c0_g1~~TRINITY_DN11343_c0_g1_i10.p1  ORF type:complete len:299 (+),score=51.60 TRINITY_DN11343_c0_g1_i10:956-1852(+)
MMFNIVIFAAALAVAITEAASRPNILFILADDFPYAYKTDWKSIMPTMKQYLADGGAELYNHQVAVPVCGPSRSSFLAGRYPHNVGYVANARKASIKAFTKVENHTIGTWMTKAGYYTAFLGKYVNGMECHVPSGWRHWGGLTCTKYEGQPLGGTYNYENSSQWHVDFAPDGVTQLTDKAFEIHTGVHQKEFLAAQTLEQVDKALGEDRPFFVHATPLMMHFGTCQGPQPAKDYAPDDPWHEGRMTDPLTNKTSTYTIMTAALSMLWCGYLRLLWCKLCCHELGSRLSQSQLRGCRPR